MSAASTALDELLKTAVTRQASDLHLTVGTPPVYRINGTLVTTTAEPLTAPVLKNLVEPILTDTQREQFERQKELDFSYSVAGTSRFRGNLLLQRGVVGAVFRAIPARPPTLDELGFPPVLKELCQRPRGLVLVTGPTGSGKSTTLASMVEYINEHRPAHIVTIEDPIEFLYRSKRSIVRQREIGIDTHTFADALKHVLRQDPDVIMVGEMRDLETIALVLTAAETGHLVLATLHTTGAPATIDRVVDVFPPHHQQQIRIQLSTVIEGVISQLLIPAKDGRGRVCAMELMVANTAVRNLIRQGTSYQIVSVMQAGGGMGMVTLDSSLKQLVAADKITPEEAMTRASSMEDFKKLYQK